MTGDLNNRNEFDADMLWWCPVGDAFVETNWLAAFGTIVTSSSFEQSRAYNRTDTRRRLSARFRGRAGLGVDYRLNALYEGETNKQISGYLVKETTRMKRAPVTSCKRH